MRTRLAALEALSAADLIRLLDVTAAAVIGGREPTATEVARVEGILAELGLAVPSGGDEVDIDTEAPERPASSHSN